MPDEASDPPEGAEEGVGVGSRDEEDERDGQSCGIRVCGEHGVKQMISVGTLIEGCSKGDRIRGENKQRTMSHSLYHHRTMRLQRLIERAEVGPTP